MKNIFVYIIIIAVIVIGAWLFMRKGSGTASLYDVSRPSGEARSEGAAPTESATSTPSVSVTQTSKPTNMIKTTSGLQYQDVVVGTGAVAKAGQTVTVQYTGTLENGKKFDSSYDRSEPFLFKLGVGEVIKGWDEGVAGMKVGGKRKLIIPASLGYGAQNVGNGLIPPNSVLLFDVELVAVK